MVSSKDAPSQYARSAFQQDRAATRKTGRPRQNPHAALNDVAVELVMVELEVANVWLEIAAENEKDAVPGIVAKARAGLFTADLIMDRLAMKESLRRAMSDARNHSWERLRLLEARANRAALAA